MQRFKKDEGGFTLIELLVVILIVGILAAIALPTFLGQQKKGQDSEAKANARNLVTHVESCFTDEQDYTKCDAEITPAISGLPIGEGEGKVSATGAADGYTITATSKSKNVFTYKKAAGVITRTCETGGEGGCKADATW